MSRMNCDMMQDLLYTQALQQMKGLLRSWFCYGYNILFEYGGACFYTISSKQHGRYKKTFRSDSYVFNGRNKAHNDDSFYFAIKVLYIYESRLPNALFSSRANSCEVNHPDCPLANFHPKMWMIRQKPIECNREDIMKLIIIGKNHILQ